MNSRVSSGVSRDEHPVIILIMKRIGKLWPRVTHFDNLLLAYCKARLGKRQRDAVARFSLNLEQELFAIQYELISGSYQPGRYRQFAIHERKPRLISAAPFRDRVVHHAIMTVLEPVFERRFYYHSYACRKNKGVHRAVDQYQQWSRQYNYVLKLDISRYFPSIVHTVLKKQLRRIIKDKLLLNLLDKVIDGSPVTADGNAGVGLPIGNLTSQYFANLYLNDIDHWLCRQPMVGKYLRYVDDLMILGNSKADLWRLKAQLEEELSSLGLTLHQSKQQLLRTCERVDVLGYKVSRERRWLRNDNGYRFQRKLKKYAWQYRVGRIDWIDLRPPLMSWIGHAKHGQTLKLRESIFDDVVFSRKPG